MGNHHSHEKSGGSESGGSRRGSQRGSEGETPAAQPAPAPAMPVLVPLEKLAKFLAQASQKEDGVNGITEKSCTKYLFPVYPELARGFFRHLRSASRCRTSHLPQNVFRSQCDIILAMLDDVLIIETYVKMFSQNEEEDVVTTEGLRRLLYTSYQISMDHHPEGPQTCLTVNKTLAAVVSGCFNNKETHSVGFVVRWLDENCKRLVLPVHRFVAHVLATRHRELSEGATAALELPTPVLERSPWTAEPGVLLGGSLAWLVAAAAPPLYSKSSKPAPTDSAAWLARIVGAPPAHWTPLYASRDHGLGANRFLHHTTSYRGPTLALISGGGALAALCSAEEWRESHRYFGGNDAAMLQLAPAFSFLARGPRLMYLNTSIRGYPKGLRAGPDPRKPLLAIEEDFEKFTLQGVPYPLECIEVWGCGDPAQREAQLDVKKWQVKEAERQRQVKLSAADWLEHPDRYLLELAGRPQYNNTSK